MNEFNIIPCPKPRQTQSDKWRKRPCVIKYRAFCDEMRRQAKDMGFLYPETMYIKFTVPMPKSWSKKKKKEQEGKPHQVRGDIDNYAKSVLDALYEEDSHIWKLSLEKVWGYEGMIVIQEHSIKKIKAGLYISALENEIERLRFEKGLIEV